MRRLLVIMLCGIGLVAPVRALAVGGPVPPVVGGGGVTETDGPFTFIALASGNGTLVERVRRNGARIEGRRLLHGQFGVPGAAFDGTTTGLSADGRTLVLADASNLPPNRTKLVVLDALRLRPQARIALLGYFTVDAISPTGRWLYLIHYRSRSNPTDYEVRAYDLAQRRLLTKPIVDPRQPDEKMQGVPLTRTVSADGRWAYTLYAGGNGAPFIHALDTVDLSAFCVDLPTVAGPDLSGARLALGPGATLRIESHGGPLAVMDTRTFAVRSPAAGHPPQGRQPARLDRSDSGFPWALGIASFAALIVLVLFVPRAIRSARPSAARTGRCRRDSAASRRPERGRGRSRSGSARRLRSARRPDRRSGALWRAPPSWRGRGSERPRASRRRRHLGEAGGFWAPQQIRGARGRSGPRSGIARQTTPAL